MFKEIWKDIPGYEGRYQVSDMGRVRSLEYHNAKGVKRIGILKPAKDANGYLRCALSKNNKLITYKVHRLVAMAFIPNPNNFPQVNHKNGIKTDNRVENLEWCDYSMNISHAYANGLIPRHIPKHYPVIIHNNETGEDLRFETLKEAGMYLGIPYQTVKKWADDGIRPYKKIHWKYSARYEVTSA